MSPMHISRENLAPVYKQPCINNIHNQGKQGDATLFYLIYYSGISINIVGMSAISLDSHCRKLQGGGAQKVNKLQSIYLFLSKSKIAFTCDLPLCVCLPAGLYVCFK